MVKQHGISLIEPIVLAALLGMLLSIFLRAENGLKEDETIDAVASIENAMQEAPIEYIDNSVRTYNTVRLKQHSDGTLWACNIENKDCYRVIK